MSDSSSLGVTAAGSVSGSFQLGYNNIVTSTASALNVGSLSADISSLSVLSRLTPQAANAYYAFNFTSGSSIKLGFNNLTQTTDLRVQLLDSVGNVVADSDGTDAQKAAYTSLTSSTGLTAGNGSYYVKVGYTDPTTNFGQDYNFQLYSGTTYDSQLTTSALTQAYDPNLFTTVQSSVFPASNVNIYNRSATVAFNASAATATAVGTLITNQSALNANGTVNASVPKEDYSFNVSQDGPVKFSFQNATNSTALHVQILDSTGTTVIADNQGTDAQKYAYQQITSGAGLKLAQGQYTVQVAYAAGQSTQSPQNYNFQLFEGLGYNQFYTTSAAVPSNATQNYSVGSNLNIYSDASATTSSRQDFNSINSDASGAINIGWLQENKTALSVSSRLTTADNTDYYSFTFQNGSALKFDLENLTSNDEVHVQLMDATGTFVIADNEGTTAQKAKFAQLSSDSGLAAQPGQYIVKVGYGANANQSQNLDYNFDFYSGSQFTAQYKTTASAQTIGNYLLNGGSLGYTANGDIASALTSSQGTIFS